MKRDSVVSDVNNFASFDRRRSLTSSENSEIEQVDGVEWGGFIFLPFSKFWQGIVGITTAFMVFASIYDYVYENTKPPVGYDYARHGCDVVYLIDTILYTLHRHLTSIQVTRVYLPKASFLLFLDYVTLLPMDLFYEFVVINKTGHSPNLPNALRIVNLLRAYRLKVFFTDESNILSTDMYEEWVIIGTHILLQFLISHLFAALWFYLGKKYTGDKTWAINMEGKDFDRESNFSWFLWSFFFVTGVYSHNWIFDIRSENDYERLVVIVLIFIGFSLTYALLYGKLIVTKLESNRRHFSFVEKMRAIKRFMRNWDAPPELQKRTYDYYEAFWRRRSAVREATFFAKLPLALRKEVNLDIFWEAVVHSHLFSKMDMSFKRSICLNMKSEFHLPGEYLYKYGDTKTKMVYVVTGVVQILSDEDFESPVASFSSGTLLGETSIVLPSPSSADVICASYCEVHTLSMPGLFAALRNYPKKTKLLLAAVKERITFANATIARAKFYSKDSSKLESMEMDKTTLHNETKWLKERYRRAYTKQMEEDEMDYDDENYWRKEEDKTAEEIIQHTSQYVDLYAFSDEVELKTDILCLKSTFPWILEPDSSFLKFWDVLMLVVVFLVCMTVPYYVAFLRRKNDGIFFSLVLVFKMFYLIDVCLDCTTAIKTKDVIITDFCAIIRYRLKQITFLVDLISLLPLFLILTVMGNMSETLALRGFLNTLLRVHKLFAFIKKKERSLWADISTVRMMKYVLLYLIAIYWTAALLFMIACPTDGECVPLSWYGVGKERDLATNSKLTDFENDLVISLFFSFSLVTAIGINNVYTQNTTDVVVCIIAILLSIALKSYSYSELTATWITKTKQRVRYQALIAEMKRFGNENKLSSELKLRIEQFLIFQWIHSEGTYMTLEKDLFHEAPAELRAAIVDQKICELLKGIPLFQDVDPEFLDMAVKVAKTHALPPFANLTVTGVRTTTLMIVRKGYCSVRSQLLGDVADGREEIAGPGSHFPVVEFLQRIPVFVSVCTLTSCEIVSFDYRDLVNTMKLCSTVYKELQEVLTRPDMDMHHLKYVSHPYGVPPPPPRAAGDADLDVATEAAAEDAATQNALYAGGVGVGVGYAKVPPHEAQYLQPFLKLGKFHFIRYLLLRRAIHPESRFLKCWEMARAFLAVCTLVVTPTIYCALAPYTEVRIVGYVLDFTAYADIVLRFNVGYYTEGGLLVSHPLYTARHYLTHAFFIDAFACFPFWLVQVQLLFGSDDAIRLLHAALVVSRGFQVYRFIGLCKYLESDIRRINDYITVFRLLVLLLILWHYLSNIFTFFRSHYDFSEDTIFQGIVFPDSNWLVNPRLFQLGARDTLRLYVLAMYFSSCVFTSTMTGAFRITGTDGLIFVLSMGFVLFFSRLVFFASISSMNMVGNINLTKYQERMKNFVSFLRHEETDDALLQQAINNFEHDWSITRGTNVYNVFSRFHSALHEDVTYDLYSRALKAVDVFAGADEVFYRTVSKHVRVVHQKRGAVIIKFNQFEDAVYIINKGRVEVGGSGGQSGGAGFGDTLQQGCMFGNLDIFKSPARYTAVAHHTVELLAIPNTLLYSIMEDHELVKKKFLAALGENPGYIGRLIRGTTDPSCASGVRFTRSSRFTRRFRLVFRSLWTADMPVHKVTVTFLNLFASYISLMVILYHVGLKSEADYVTALIHLLDVMFLLKLYIGFRTAYEDKTTGVIVTDLHKIAKRYVKSWFFVDLVSVLPLEVMGYAFSDPVQGEEAAYWLKLNRTLRVLFLVQFFNSNLKRVNVSNYMRLVQAFVWTTLAIEAMSCIYLMVSCYTEHCKYAVSYFNETMVITHSDTQQALLAQIYILNMFMGTGFRDVVPSELVEVGFAILCAIVFQFISAFTICCIASFIEVTSLSKSNYRHHVLKLKDYLKDRDLSPYLLSKTITYALQLWLRAKGEWLPVLLQEAPTYLREDLMLALYADHLRHNMLYSGTHEDFLAQLTAKLDRCVFFPGDYIVERGDVDGNMYFIHDGEVEVVHRNKYFVETLIEKITTNEVFSMAQGLYNNKPHIHIYRAKTVVDLLILNRDKCKETLKIFPAAAADIYGKAQEIDFTL